MQAEFCFDIGSVNCEHLILQPSGKIHKIMVNEEPTPSSKFRKIHDGKLIARLTDKTTELSHRYYKFIVSMAQLCMAQFSTGMSYNNK